MRIENRELFATFWDERDRAGVVALVIGWVGDDPATLVPVVAYNYGVEEYHGRYVMFSTIRDAQHAAVNMKGPL